MATVEQLQAQLTKVRQEMAKLTELLESLDKAPTAKKTTAK
jgi:prefoldin subunit 5